MLRHVFSGLIAGLTVITVLPALELSINAADPKMRVVTSAHFGVNPAGQDTLITTVAWSLSDDGRGGLDSLRVNVTALLGGWITVRPPLGTISVTVRQGVPFGDASWDITGQVCAYRRGKSSCANSTPVRVTIVDVAPPVPTGITVNNVIR